MRSKNGSRSPSSGSVASVKGRSSRKSRSSSSSNETRRSRSRSRSRSSSQSEGYRLHIGDIGAGVTKGDLVDIFKKFGPLKEFWMANSPPCFGFAVYKHKRDAKEALNGCDGLSVFGSRLRVSMARPRTRGYGRRNFSPSLRCYHCGNAGHFYRDCPEKYDNRYSSSSRSRSERNGKSDRYGSSRDYREYKDRREHSSRHKYY